MKYGLNNTNIEEIKIITFLNSIKKNITDMLSKLLLYLIPKISKLVHCAIAQRG